MAGDWMKIECCLPEKPEVIRMADALGLHSDDVVGKLLRTWRWFGNQTLDGYACGVTDLFLDTHIGVTGWAQAMLDVGWLDAKNGSIAMPNFDRHNSKAAKARALSLERMREKRYASNVTKLLPEKRREEKSKRPPYPPELDNNEFKQAWQDWLIYKGKQYKPIGQQRKLSELAKIGSDRAIAAINHSMAQGWKGIYESKDEAKEPEINQLLTSFQWMAKHGIDAEGNPRLIAIAAKVNDGEIPDYIFKNAVKNNRNDPEGFLKALEVKT